jgi:hypothetical protein
MLKASSKSGAARDTRFGIQYELPCICAMSYWMPPAAAFAWFRKPIARDPKCHIATIAIQHEFRLPSSASQNF